MRLSEKVMKSHNFRTFRYRKQQCVISEIDLNIEHFNGACCYKHGILCCILNINLSNREKQKVIHKFLCKYNKLRRI